MVQLTVEAGVCGFTTAIRASCEDMQNVAIEYDTTCPHVAKAREEMAKVDALAEIFAKPHQTAVYAALSKHLPHTACPTYSAFLKAIEAAAGLALPRDVSMKFAPS
jgi:hypothetical protein